MFLATSLLVISCLIWAVNVVCIVLSYWIPQMLDRSFILFLAVIIEWGLMFFVCNKNGMDNSLIPDETPRFFVILGILSIIYTLGNSLISMIILWNGGPHIENGVYCLWNHRFIQKITKEEYDFLLLVESRFATGHILTFSAAPMMVFSALRERRILQKYLKTTAE